MKMTEPVRASLLSVGHHSDDQSNNQSNNQSIEMSTVDETLIKQSINQSNNRSNKQPQLKKTLGWQQLISLGIGCTIGAGIFAVTGKVARDQTGPALFLSYIVSGLTCLLSALCYAEFSAMSVSSGSAYSYARQSLGEVLGFVIGWDLILEYAVGAAVVAQSWSSHLQQFCHLLGFQIPAAISVPFWAYDSDTGEMGWSSGGIDIFAILITGLVTAVLVRGITESTKFNNIVVAIKLFVVAFVILVGMFYVDVNNFSPFMPYGFASFSLFGNPIAGQVNAAGDPSGVLAGSAIVFFSYIGFDSVSTQAEECKRPQRDLPIGIIGSLGISTVLYVLVSLVLVGLVPYQTIDREVGVAAAFGAVGLVWAEYLISLGALLGLTSVLLVTMLGQPRVCLAMARDGLLPVKFFAAIHRQYQTPYKATILTGCVVACLSSMIPLSILVELVSIGTLSAFFVTNISVLVLRRTQPSLHRPFRCPWCPVVPFCGALMCFILMLSLPASNWIRLAIWLGIGLCVYFWWGKQNAQRVRRLKEQQAQFELLDDQSVNQSNELSDDQSIDQVVEMDGEPGTETFDMSSEVEGEPHKPSINQSNNQTNNQTIDESVSPLSDQESESGERSVDENTSILSEHTDSSDVI